MLALAGCLQQTKTNKLNHYPGRKNIRPKQGILFLVFFGTVGNSSAANAYGAGV